MIASYFLHLKHNFIVFVSQGPICTFYWVTQVAWMLSQIVPDPDNLYIFVHLFPTLYNWNLDMLCSRCHSAPIRLQIFIRLLFWQGWIEYMNTSLGKIIMLASVSQSWPVFEHVNARCWEHNKEPLLSCLLCHTETPQTTPTCEWLHFIREKQKNTPS